MLVEPLAEAAAPVNVAGGCMFVGDNSVCSTLPPVVIVEYIQ